LNQESRRRRQKIKKEKERRMVMMQRFGSAGSGRRRACVRQDIQGIHMNADGLGGAKCKKMGLG